jgi:hypothetical protein
VPTYLPAIESHLTRLLSAAADIDGTMWPSVLDVRTGRYPAKEHVPRRVYRLIGAPRGSTLYWDQPLVVAACVFSKLTGKHAFAEAADRYVDAFLSKCVSANAMFRWGNHTYYDVFRHQVVDFHGGPHELRPITPAWDIFWRHSPERTAAYIRAMAGRHVYDPVTGAFNRHDDGKKGHAFIEAGGILCESVAWLCGRTNDDELLETALRIAGYSYSHRDPLTGLMPNEPDMGRWDSKVCTSEVGLWAQCLLRARHYTSRHEFSEMARQATRAYLTHAYDVESGKYFGQIRVDGGEAVIPSESGYWPREHSDPWSVDQWPTHDYPMPLAEACLTLHAQTSDAVFLEAVRNWARIILDSRPARTGAWAYAESYGRCIHFLTRAGLQLGDEHFLAWASQLADEAMEQLYEEGMFQGYPDGHVYESVDGVGYLLLALIFLETRQMPLLCGFGF